MSNRMYFGATGRDLHIDQLLTEMAMGYRPQGMIADRIFPVVEVPKQSDIYAIFSRADRLRIENTVRAPGTEARKFQESVSSASYFADNYALKSPIVIEDKANADPIYVSQLLEGKAQTLLDKLSLDWENRIALNVTSGSNVGSYSGVASAWTDWTNSDPLTSVNLALDNVRNTTGITPNRMVFGVDAWYNFRRNTTVRNLIFGVNNGGGYPSVQQVANLLDIEEVLVGRAYKNSGNEAQNESLSAIWGHNVLAYYAPNAPSISQPSFAYSLRWVQPGLANMVVERHPYDPKTKSEEIEAGYYQKEVICGPEYGFLLGATATSASSGGI